MSLFISSLSCFNWAAFTIYANILTFWGLSYGAIEIGYGGWSLIEVGPVCCPALPPIISSGVGFYIQIGIASSGGSINDEAYGEYDILSSTLSVLGWLPSLIYELLFSPF